MISSHLTCRIASSVGDDEPHLPPPLLGEHTHSLLSRIGYEDDKIESLIQEGAALVADPDEELWAKVRTPEAVET